MSEVAWEQVEDYNMNYNVESYFKEAVKWIRQGWKLIHFLKISFSWEETSPLSKQRVSHIINGLKRKYSDLEVELSTMEENIKDYVSSSSQDSLNNIWSVIETISSHIQSKQSLLSDEVSEVEEDVQEEIVKLLSYEITSIPEDDRRKLSWFCYEIRLPEGKTISSGDKPEEIKGEDGRVTGLKYTIPTFNSKTGKTHELSLIQE